MTLPSISLLRAVTFALATLCLVALDTGSAAKEAERPFGQNVRLRGNLNNSRLQLDRHKKAHVAFMGGSITEMEGYRPMVTELLKKRYPETNLSITSAGISSTCSTTGAFRMASDVLSKGPVDLFFVEFAVNDDQDARHSREECIRGMEGIIRHARSVNPNSIEAHEAVAEHYGVSTINLAKQVAEEITAGTLTWKQYGGVHPAPRGNAIAARMIDELLERAWKEPLSKGAMLAAHTIPETPLDSLSYWKGHFVDPAQAQLKSGWDLGVPDWKSLPGSKRERFISIPMLSATEPGAELTLSFEGTSVGAYIVAGPDAGIAEASIDGGPFQPVDLYHPFSKGLHYPRTVILGTASKAGRHQLVLRISKDTRSTGHAMRIMQFGVN
jgi:lysophospholipase L1-like esterase